MTEKVNRPIVLFTDFGPGLYVGQVRAVLATQAPHCPVIELLSDAPAFDPKHSAYLLAALAAEMPADAVMLCVVDPGVGTRRLPMVAEMDGRWFVGPENGLFEPLLRRARDKKAWAIHWQPPRLSATFHGRDLFAPIAARLAQGASPEEAGCQPIPIPQHGGWPDELAEIIYVDHYGNAFTGLRAEGIAAHAVLRVGEVEMRSARTYGEVSAGVPFWYQNSLGLVEITVSHGRADSLLGLSVGDEILISAIPTERSDEGSP